jgi:two-component system CheB/CheR fusion protein
MAERVLNLIPTDIGRPIAHIKPNIDCPGLEMLIASVIETVTPIEREVRDAQGNWMLLRIRPYKNTENRIDGAVLALIDIHAIKEHEEGLRKLRLSAEALLDVVQGPAAVLDGKLRVRSANRAFYDAFGVGSDGADGKPLAALTDGPYDAPALHDRLAREVRSDAPQSSIVLDGAGDGARVEVIARWIPTPDEDGLIVIGLRQQRRHPGGETAGGSGSEGR